MRYHLNTRTGEPGLCSASDGRCPFGAPEDHYSSPDSARLAFESKRESFNRSLATIPLSEIVDIDLFNKMLKEKFIYASVHPDDDSYVLYCYSPLTQIAGKWNDATKLARGIILRRGSANLNDAVVLERPWNKFFTLQQQESGWHLGDEENNSAVDDSFSLIDFQAPATVQDKLDGSMGILYRGPNGLPALATKGSFGSPQALDYTRMLQENEELSTGAEALLKQNRNKTALFELIGPKNRIVLAYKEKEIVLLGGSEKSTGNSIDPEKMRGWSDAGLPVVERLSAKTLEEALALPPRENREGVVVTTSGKTPMKLKIKQADYLRLHRIVTMFSKKESRALVFDLKEEAKYSDLLKLAETRDVAYFPTIKAVLEVDGFSKGDEDYEFIRSRREKYFQEILFPRADAIKEAKTIVDSLDESYFAGENPKKRFAAEVDKLGGDKATLFTLYRARLEGKAPEELSAFNEIRRAVTNVKDTED